MTCNGADPGAAMRQAVGVVAPVHPGSFREEVGLQFFHESFDLLARKKSM